MSSTSVTGSWTSWVPAHTASCIGRAISRRVKKSRSSFWATANHSTPEYSRRIEREAMAMARLRGTSAVYVHGLNVAQDGSLYLVMEVLVGKDFEAYLREAERVGGPAQEAEAARAHATDRGYAGGRASPGHRASRPEAEQRVHRRCRARRRRAPARLWLGEDAGRQRAHRRWHGAGTPSYISPEAWKGISGILDQRVDVYSLGVLVFRALSGRTPAPKGNLLDVCAWGDEGRTPQPARAATELAARGRRLAGKSAGNRAERSLSKRARAVDLTRGTLGRARQEPF